MKKIKEGDKVNIYWENVTAEFNVTVKYIPCQTGDSWIFERKNGTIFYVNTFAKMNLI